MAAWHGMAALWVWWHPIPNLTVILNTKQILHKTKSHKVPSSDQVAPSRTTLPSHGVFQE